LNSTPRQSSGAVNSEEWIVEREKLWTESSGFAKIRPMLSEENAGEEPAKLASRAPKRGIRSESFQEWFRGSMAVRAGVIDAGRMDGSAIRYSSDGRLARAADRQGLRHEVSWLSAEKRAILDPCQNTGSLNISSTKFCASVRI
jgi:hypothetical protein